MSIKIVLIITLICFSTSCKQAQDSAATKFYTWNGLEPDRWASVWLMKRHATPDAEITILPVGASLRDVTAIATPTSTVRRTHGKSNYENLAAAYQQNDDHALVRIGEIINELEISPWSKSTPLVAVVERQFRELQYAYDRTNVPLECYSGFFDRLYQQLSESDSPDLSDVEQALSPQTVCSEHEGVIATAPKNQVFEYSTDHVLNMIAAEQNIVFVDTREDAEFDERHIPGAVNLKLREVSEQSVQSIKDADLVIAYCIKDFRGYEVALAMSKAGVERVGIMNPFGLKGWVDQGLPIVDSNLSESQALEKLKSIALTGV